MEGGNARGMKRKKGQRRIDIVTCENQNRYNFAVIGHEPFNLIMSTLRLFFLSNCTSIFPRKLYTKNNIHK